MLGLILLSLVLAALTWRFVERPFRDRTVIGAKHLLGYGLTASLGLLALVGVAPYLARGVDGYPEHLAQFVVTLDARTDYVERGFDALNQANFQDDGRKKLLLIGNSFGQDFYNVIHEAGAFKDHQIVTRRFLSICQIYLGDEDVAPLIAPFDKSCAKRLQAEDLRGIAAQADVVVFAFSWRPWSGDRIAETVANFGFRDDQRVLVIGRKQLGRFNPRSFLSMKPESWQGIRNRPIPEQTTTNAAMKRGVPPAMFVDTQGVLCGDRPDCPLFTPEGALISFDGNHLTQAGARYLGARLFRDPRLAPFALAMPTPRCAEIRIFLLPFLF